MTSLQRYRIAAGGYFVHRVGRVNGDSLHHIAAIECRCGNRCNRCGKIDSCQTGTDESVIRNRNDAVRNRDGCHEMLVGKCETANLRYRLRNNGRAAGIDDGIGSRLDDGVAVVTAVIHRVACLYHDGLQVDTFIRQLRTYITYAGRNGQGSQSIP